MLAALLASTVVMTARAQSEAPLRLDRSRFTVIAFPADAPLARTLLDSAAARDTFPGLPRPRAHVLIAIAPDARRFREWAGPGAPEWGAAIAVPEERRIVMQGRAAASDAGDPVQVLRHELAHLALHETMGELPPRWFDEGYASFCAREWGRDEVLAASVGLVVSGVPALDSLDAGFYGGAARAGATYALAYRAVADLAALDPERGLTLFFRYWRETRSMDRAMRLAYGITEAGFEQQWRQRTMRRYGLLAAAANLSVLLAVTGVLVLPLYVARRRRDRERLVAMVAAEEAAERARRAAASDAATLDALLAAAPPRGTPDDDAAAKPPDEA